jgi:hypothetical protein
MKTAVLINNGEKPDVPSITANKQKADQSIKHILI